MKDKQTSAQIANQLPGSLPEGVIFKEFQVEPERDNRPDAKAILGTAQKEFPIVIEVQNTGGTASLREIARQAKTYVSGATIPFVAGTFFGQKAREVAKEEGVGYIDLAGNFYLNRDDTYIERIVDKNPRSQKPPLKSLFAPVSSRITRALLIEPQRTWLLNELSEATDVSLGQAYQVIERMIEEEIIGRNTEGKLALKNPVTLLEEWKKVYPTYQQQKFTFFSYEQAYVAILNAVLKVGQQERLKYALGFFTGADMIAPFIQGLTKVQIYVEKFSDIEKWKTVLNLQEVQSGGNIELFVPYDSGIFYGMQQIESKIVKNIPIVSDLQLYMDLFNNPARGEEQAQHLREVRLSF